MTRNICEHVIEYKYLCKHNEYIKEYYGENISNEYSKKETDIKKLKSLMGGDRYSIKRNIRSWAKDIGEDDTQRRADEMHVDYIFQGAKNKTQVINQVMMEHELTYENIGYIGDDLNDLASMSYAGFKACPADACEAIKKLSDYVSTVSGGKGTVQDVMRFVLNKLEKWDGFIDEVIMKGY